MIFPNIRNKSGGAVWLIDGDLHFVRSRVVVDQKGAFVGIVSGSGFFITSESPFSPASLFAAGEQGLIYDIGDFDRYMSESELGPDISTPRPIGNFGVSVTSGVITVTKLVSAEGGGLSFGTWEYLTGKYYRVQFKYRQLSGSGTVSVTTPNFGQVLPNDGSTFVYDRVGKADAGLTYLYIRAMSTGLPLQFEVTEYSIREHTAINTATLFQDAAGTIPVTAVEQPVGLILDKSGRGNHASQPTTTARGILRQDANSAYYIDIDGTDDNYVTGSIDFTGTDKMTIWAGLRKVDDTARMLCELSANVNNNNGTFAVVTGNDVDSFYQSSSRGNATSVGTLAAKFTTGLYPAPDSAVITAQHDISADLSRIRRNGSSAGAIDGTADKGAGNFGNYPLYLFSRAGTSLRWNGNFYGLIIRGAATKQAQLEQTEQWLNSKMGGIY